MMEDMVPVYEFGEGHQIFRITSDPMFQRFIGAPRMPEEVAGFLLVNHRERPVSAMWMHTEEGELSNQIRDPIGGSKMGWPRKMPWAPYWRDFVEQTMSEDIADANFEMPIVVPDDLGKAMDRPADEAELQRHIETFNQPHVDWRAAEKGARNHMFAMLQQVFDPFGPGAQHAGVKRTRFMPGMPASIEYIEIYLKNALEGQTYRVEFVEDLPGWGLREARPRARRKTIAVEGRTLVEAWQKLAHESQKDLRPFIPAGELDAWWDSQRVEGEPVYDLEPYFLLGTTSPMLFDNPMFRQWVAQQVGA